ncbi:TPA: hypothetical protein EYP66_12930 [Candidatus Poribacteria bacterium]|nr:hypothetical protein [Candidatus Poribacteria bacterium]
MAERIDPENPTTLPSYWQHYVVYEYALPYVTDKIAMDAGCGEGYGTYLLAQSAKKIVGVDYHIGILLSPTFRGVINLNR